MGQRHQIYVFVKNDEGKVQGACIHHQWLYGRSVALKVIEVMSYAKKAMKDKYHPLTGNSYGRGLSNCLLALYQLDMKTGGFNGSASHMNYLPTDTAMQECVADPRLGDNNDGITVFDFTNPKSLAYCIVNIGEQFASDSVSKLTPWVPHTIGEYVTAYYPKKAQAKADKESAKEFELVYWKAEQLVCMGQADLARLFPAVFTGQEEARKATL